MNDESKHVERVIGFDSHPDSFTAAILRGPTPAAAVVEKTFHKVPMSQLQSWAIGTLLKTFSSTAVAGVGPRRIAAVKLSG